MKYKEKYEKLNLPDYMQFGIEIEANNVKTKMGYILVKVLSL